MHTEVEENTTTPAPDTTNDPKPPSVRPWWPRILLSLLFIAASVSILVWQGVVHPLVFGYYTWRGLFRSEAFLQSLTVVITNGFVFPLIFECIRTENYTESVVGFMTFLTSTLYHLCEALNIRIWGMNAGNWHRLDNVFMILSTQGLLFWIFFATDIKQTALWDRPLTRYQDHSKHFAHEQRVLNLFRWVSLAFTLTCQEKGPWNVFYTILPIVAAGVVAIFRYVFLVPIQYRPRYNWRIIGMAIVLLGVGIFFFIVSCLLHHY
jgi:hypothetical protein